MSKKGRHEEHEHENEERWLISYADFITLLMALFIVMYAMSNVDAARFQKLAVSLSGAFNVASRSPVDLPSLPGRKGDTLAAVLKDRPEPPHAEEAPKPDAPESMAPLLEMQEAKSGMDGKQLTPPGEQDTQAAEAAQAQKDAAQQATEGKDQQPFTEEELKRAAEQLFAGERRTLEQVKDQINSLLEVNGLESLATVSISKSGRVLNVRLPSNLLFSSGSADLASAASTVLDKMSNIIERSGQNVRIEGHTDNVPVRSGRFASNWDLSTARATRVLLYLQQVGSIPPGRLSAAGYGEFRPLAPNDTPEGRAANRRVEFVITAEDLAS